VTTLSSSLAFVQKLPRESGKNPLTAMNAAALECEAALVCHLNILFSYNRLPLSSMGFDYLLKTGAFSLDVQNKN
jgi:hypothetical protein